MVAKTSSKAGKAPLKFKAVANLLKQLVLTVMASALKICCCNLFPLL